MSSGGIRRFLSHKKEYNRLNEQLMETQARLSQKQNLLDRAQGDDAFLEMEARRNLSLVRKDEIEFRFVETKENHVSSEKMEKIDGAGR